MKATRELKRAQLPILASDPPAEIAALFAEGWELLRDISAHLDVLKTRLNQIPDTASLPEERERAMGDLLSTIRALRRYR